MAKRYHQSAKDRLAESRAEERHLFRMNKSMGAEHYAGMDPRRRQEMEDAGMIQEDHRAIANLPQNVIMREWPKGGMYMTDDEDDTIHGVNRQMDLDGSLMNKSLHPKKV